MAPRAGRIVGVRVDVFGLFATPTPRSRHQHGRLRLAQQHRVLRHRDHVVEPRLCLQKVEDFRSRKAPVESNEKPRPRKGAAQQRQQPGQDTDRPLGGDRLAVPQQRRTQVLLGFTVEGQDLCSRLCGEVYGLSHRSLETAPKFAT